jgi:hypothetical protein
MRDLILKTLRESVKAYPELKGYLSDITKKVLEDGVDWHMKFPAVYEEYEMIDWDIVDPKITQDDIDEAVKRWDKMMPKYKGLLDAEFQSGE